MPRHEDPTARGRILEAASSLFYERGVNAVGLGEIVAMAGTGRAVLYRHFPGKDLFILSYLHHVAEQIDASIDAVLEDVAADRAVVTVARHVADRVSHPDYRGCPFRNYLRETRDTDSAAGLFALGRVSRFRRRIEGLVLDQGAQHPDVVAERIWLILEGLYASTPYPDRAGIAHSAVRHIETIVAAG